MTGMLYIIVPVVLVLVFSLVKKKWKSIPWYIYIPIVSLFIAFVIYFQFSSMRKEEKITRIMDLPDFEDEMMESVTTLPAEVAKKYFDAVYAYNLGDFDKAGDFVKKAIKEYEENATNVGLKDHIKVQHYEKVGQIYLFACKTFTLLHENTLAYEYAKKSIQYR